MKTKFTFTCIVVALCANTYITAYTQAVNKKDSMALVDLYNSTNGPGWEDHSNWLKGPVETWHGIYLVDTRVNEIDLSFNNLNGKIPASIGNLTALGTLNLFSNQLSGSIPSSLPPLYFLDLGENQLSGSIPGSLYAYYILLEKNNSKRQHSVFYWRGGHFRFGLKS